MFSALKKLTTKSGPDGGGTVGVGVPSQSGSLPIPQAAAGVVSTSTGRLAVTGPTGKNPPLIAEDNTGMHSE